VLRRVVVEASTVPKEVLTPRSPRRPDVPIAWRWRGMRVTRFTRHPHCGMVKEGQFPYRAAIDWLVEAIPDATARAKIFGATACDLYFSGE
jgi:hypothetical protein